MIETRTLWMRTGTEHIIPIYHLESFGQKGGLSCSFTGYVGNIVLPKDRGQSGCRTQGSCGLVGSPRHLVGLCEIQESGLDVPWARSGRALLSFWKLQIYLFYFIGGGGRFWTMGTGFQCCSSPTPCTPSDLPLCPLFSFSCLFPPP